MHDARVLGAAVVAVAAAAIALPVRAEPAASYPQAMADGARLMTAKDFAAAAKAFAAALVARPKDPRALAELSWPQQGSPAAWYELSDPRVMACRRLA